MQVKDLDIEKYKTLLKEREEDTLNSERVLEELTLLKCPYCPNQSVYSMQFLSKLWWQLSLKQEKNNQSYTTSQKIPCRWSSLSHREQRQRHPLPDFKAAWADIKAQVETNETEISPCVCGQLIFNKAPRHTTEKRQSLWKMVFKKKKQKTRYPMKIYISYHRKKINSKPSKGLKIRPQETKLLEENIRVINYVTDLGNCHKPISWPREMA